MIELTSTRLCAACRHLASHTPMMCGLHRDTASGIAKLCQPLRTGAGVCGPEGSFWQPADTSAVPAVVVAFPRAHRVSA